MKYDVFPKQYEKELGEKTYNNISSERGKHDEVQQSYRERFVDSDVATNVSVILMFASGVVGCSVACSNTGEIVTSLATGIVVMIVSFFVAVAVSVIISSKGESMIKEDEDTYQKWREKQLKELDIKVQDYHVKFENEAQKLSLKFYNDPMTEEIVNKMKRYVERSFSNANINSHVEQVTVDMYCRVYSNKVDWVYENDVENYIFANNRCAILKNSLEQAALARAIARKLQNYIKQTYSVDEKGTKSVIEVKITENPNYKTGICDCSWVEIKYRVPNQYYKKSRSW